MKILHWPRRAGMTTKLARWVKAGQKIDAYPGWSRVLLVPTVNDSIRIRREHGLTTLTAQQVFSFNEWRTAFSVHPMDVEIAIDRAHLLIAESLNGRGRIAYLGFEDDDLDG